MRALSVRVAGEGCHRAPANVPRKSQVLYEVSFSWYSCQNAVLCVAPASGEAVMRVDNKNK